RLPSALARQKRESAPFGFMSASAGCGHNGTTNSPASHSQPLMHRMEGAGSFALDSSMALTSASSGLFLYRLCIGKGADWAGRNAIARRSAFIEISVNGDPF